MSDVNSMRIRKYLPYLLVLVAGFFLGSLFWTGSDGSNETPTEAVATTYTCSMHPEVRLDRPGTCPKCGMDLVAGGPKEPLLEGQFQMEEEALALANISTFEVRAMKAPDQTLKLSGIIRTNEKTNTIQTSLFDGRIERLDINFVGQKVRKGQEIGLIFAPELYLAQDKLLTSASYKDTHVKLYKASRYGLGLWKLTDEQIDQILRTREPMLNFPIVADVSGTVTEITARVGNFYSQGDPLFTLSDLSTVWAIFDAYEDQIPHLSVGQQVSILAGAQQGSPVEARISFIEPVLDGDRRTVAVRVDLNNRDGLLKPGMFAEAQVEVGTGREGIWIPKSAVLWTGRRSLVYLRDPASRAVFEAREITLGTSLNEYYEVIDGLQPGDVVVANGTFTVDAAAQLSGNRSMMQPGPNPPHHMHPGTTEPLGLSGGEQQRVGKIVRSYLDLKESLVRSDEEGVRNSAQEQLLLIEDLGASFPGSAQTPAIVEIRGLLEKIAKAGGIKEQRVHFKPLSRQMILLAERLDEVESPLYIQYCPMADGNRGGYWLSLESEIANPYFGDMMLRCGEIRDTLQ